jgi:hypothetical protein
MPASLKTRAVSAMIVLTAVAARLRDDLACCSNMFTSEDHQEEAFAVLLVRTNNLAVQSYLNASA